MQCRSVSVQAGTTGRSRTGRCRSSALAALRGAVLCLLVGGALVLRPGIAATEEVPPWNVLIITVDCLRPDHMSLYGYERDTTPYLKRFAEEAVVFDNAFATSTWTSPGVASIITGYYPPVHAQNGRYSF